MAICRKFHKPDYFITMTCNPHWPEIEAELKEGQKAQDRPDLVARVFKLKKDQLLRDLKKNGVLGKTVADIYVIEFQKRGLPHAHILIILANQDRTARLSRKSVTNSVSWLMTKSGSECSRNQPI